ncbi:YihY/virulence factor BrkB family protein [Desulforhopalus singaporensis]|uniref:Membrane protein n=1 Tax=Desulforhopalus singaporensis TaxID=91360 RepID=A0A1H0TI11_9BACT|nr:YihY/virulence factor BrkB family protein [Desulforhopalus singaporensis]SDP53683.1 membrane protein [Desulforhopalus singaporensis]
MTRESFSAWLDLEPGNGSKPERLLRYLLRLVWITVRQFGENNLSLRSGALTYTILLSLVPMLAMSTAIVKGLGGGNQLRVAVYSYIETLENTQTFSLPGVKNNNRDEQLPSAEETSDNSLTKHLRSAVDKLFGYVERTNFTTLGTFGVIGILLSVLLVFNHIESAMNAIWRINTSRPLMRKIADYTTLLILFPFSLNVAFAASAFIKNPALASKIDILIPFSWLQSLLLQALPVLFITVSFYAIYIFFPNTKVKSLPASAGAFLAALLWFGVQNIYISMQIGVAKYNAIYGSFATFPLFLVWIYLGWIFILAGAQLAFALQNLKTFRIIPRADSPSLLLGAAFDIMDHIYGKHASGEFTDVVSMSRKLDQYPDNVVLDVANTLIAGGIFHISSSDQRLLPANQESGYDPGKVVHLILGKEAPGTEGGKRSLAAIRKAEESAVREYRQKPGGDSAPAIDPVTAPEKSPGSPE